MKQEHNSSSLSVTIAKFASKEGPELKMVHTGRHMSQTHFHTSLHKYALYVPMWVAGERGVRKQQVKERVRITPVSKYVTAITEYHNRVQTQSSTCDQV